jgi:hypothetical protein
MMKLMILLPLLTLEAILTPVTTPSAAETQSIVIVNFRSPESYTDAALDRHAKPTSQSAVLQVLAHEIERLATPRLPQGSRLTVDVTDVDLAGRQSPALGFEYDHIRVYYDYTAPRIKLSYVLSAADGRQTMAADDVVVQGRGYLDGPSAGLDSSPLRYEKALIKNWVRETFGGGQSPLNG